MYFEIIGEIADVEVIAVGGNIDGIMRLRRQFGAGRWRKLKGVAQVRVEHGGVRLAELHWYEAHGLGRRKMTIERFLD
ncbi:MAG TPA: hypothetical protein PLT20_03000 [Sedimentisphaerales bacterium]|nr:hypothetical protein [Sedimentisphaerales bacterium]HQI27027.1 hypothetical protein [Sedimentisphaerales bacterium]